jgi:ligand-binding sensor domain-containing protein
MIHLWIGTDRGLVHGLMDNLEAVSGLEGRVVTVLEWDAEGGIMWVGTDLGLVPLERDDKDWVLGREMTERNGGLPSNLVLALALSSGDVGDKRLWVGTPAGLGCYAY